MSEPLDDATPASPPPEPLPVAATVLPPTPTHPLDDKAWADVVATAVEKAKAGNMSAANIVRLVERFGRRYVRLDVPPILDAGGVARAQAALLAETFAGRVEPRHGVALSTMIENRRRSIEMLDFEKELRALNDANAENEKNARGGRR
jgi:hypothetical protein